MLDYNVGHGIIDSHIINISQKKKVLKTDDVGKESNVFDVIKQTRTC